MKNKPYTVILADDASDLRLLLANLLERESSITVIAQSANVVETESLVVEHLPKALILDLAMPGGGAFDLIFRLRQHNPNLAIIVLSGYPAASSGELCLSLGADLYIEKGLPIKDLHRLVIETVNSRAKIAKETIINRANYAE